MGNLLFSPSGRVGPADFMKGAIVLIIIGAVLQILPLINYSLGSMLSMLGIVTVWCWVVLFIKRLHDAGKSGWLVLVIILVFIIVAMIVNSIVTSMFAGDISAEMQEATKDMMEGGGDLASMMAKASEMGAAVAKKTALPLAISGAVVSYAIAYIVNMMLKSDAGDNQYGPAT